MNGFVYLATGPGWPCKIGRTLYPRVREKAFATYPVDVRIVHCIRSDRAALLEDHFLKKHETKRIRGEWFDLTPGDIREFQATPDCPENVGLAIIRVRMKCGLHNRNIASGRTGLGWRCDLKNWESGEKVPTADEIEALAEGWGVLVSEFVPNSFVEVVA